MNELEQQLIDLGSALEIPAAPDVVAAVRDRLPSRPPPRPPRPPANASRTPPLGRARDRTRGPARRNGRRNPVRQARGRARVRDQRGGGRARAAAARVAQHRGHQAASGTPDSRVRGTARGLVHGACAPERRQRRLRRQRRPGRPRQPDLGPAAGDRVPRNVEAVHSQADRRRHARNSRPGRRRAGRVPRRGASRAVLPGRARQTARPTTSDWPATCCSGSAAR